MADQVTRRSFVEKVLIATGVVSTGTIVGSAYSALKSSGPSSSFAAPSGHSMDMPGMSPAPATALTPEEMDAHHKQAVTDFLQNQKTPLTKGKGNQPLAPTLEGDVKVFKLTMDEVQWEAAPGTSFTARGYNGTIPGPILRATEGDKVRIVVTNNLKESSSIHWHGLNVPNAMDGVPFITQDPIKPGATFTYEFPLTNSGTHMYHSHHNAMDQVNRGLLGAFIVDPKDKSTYPAYDREYVMVLNDLNLGFTINGKGFPATDALTAKKGEKILIRFLNEGIMSHPMHLHGMPMTVFRRDGYPVNPPQMCDTVDVAPGNRYDVLVDVTETGIWAFHCHILNHAESESGMFGLVTALVVS
jgi:FtsP/CotA-like multicopper oxidase with cupredoxin domain